MPESTSGVILTNKTDLHYLPALLFDRPFCTCLNSTKHTTRSLVSTALWFTVYFHLFSFFCPKHAVSFWCLQMRCFTSNYLSWKKTRAWRSKMELLSAKRAQLVLSFIARFYHVSMLRITKPAFNITKGYQSRRKICLWNTDQMEA